jgi:hypothetical protein
MTISPESPSLEHVHEEALRIDADSPARFSPAFDRAPARGVCEVELAPPGADAAHEREHAEAWCAPGVGRA